MAARRLTNVLRWIVFLPAGYVAGIATYGLGMAIGGFFRGGDVLLVGFAGLGSAVAMLLVADWVAPPTERRHGLWIATGALGAALLVTAWGLLSGDIFEFAPPRQAIAAFLGTSTGTVVGCRLTLESKKRRRK